MVNGQQSTVSSQRSIAHEGRSTGFFQRFSALLVLFLALTLANAQTEDRQVVHSTMFGAGFSDVYDSYLSPYAYTGPEGRIVRETYRMTNLAKGKVSVQTLVNAHGGYLDSPAGNAHYWVGGINYGWNWYYNFPKTIQFSGSSLKFLAGAGVNGYLGGIYNTRNGNNPAQLKLDVMTQLSGMALYDFKIKQKPCQLRYQLTVPFIGLAYSQDYGQSYYEVFSLGNSDNTAVFAWFGNKPSMQHLLTFDFPLKKSTLRVGYIGVFNQSKWKNLRYHHYSNGILVGWVKTFNRL